MSMNLHFERKSCCGCCNECGIACERESDAMDFPFQTPTELSYAVIEENDTEKQLSLIEKHLKDREWGKKEIRDMIKKIKELLEDPKLRLVVW